MNQRRRAAGWRRLWAIGLVAAAAACTSGNPAFDEDMGGGSGGSQSTEGIEETERPPNADGGPASESDSADSGNASTGRKDDSPDPERCGDGVVEPEIGEVCDDGINDGAYGGCEPGCEALAAHCGDGIVDEEEACDDDNPDPADGCLSNCAVPQSCLEIREAGLAGPSGTYKIRPDGLDGNGEPEAPFAVFCDMETDGGGYTFLKMDANDELTAQEAESACGAWGMQLWIPRTPDHLHAGWEVATDPSIGPSGNVNYVRIMAIYPDDPGALCAQEALVSDNEDCHWHAGDDGPFYVNGGELGISEPNGNNAPGESMRYDWDRSGQISWYDDVTGGANSDVFLCDVGDFWGR